MNITSKTTGPVEPRTLLSSLWLFAVLTYLYGDVFTLFFMRGAQETALAMSTGAVTTFAILMETSVAMVLLARVLRYRINRWANIVAGIVHTALASWSMTGSTPPLFTVLFMSLAIACTLFIIWYAWRWRRLEGQHG